MSVHNVDEIDRRKIMRSEKSPSIKASGVIWEIRAKIEDRLEESNTFRCYGPLTTDLLQVFFSVITSEKSLTHPMKRAFTALPFWPSLRLDKTNWKSWWTFLLFHSFRLKFRKITAAWIKIIAKMTSCSNNILPDKGNLCLDLD